VTFLVRLPGLKQDRQCKRLEQTASTRHWSRLQVDLLSPSPDITTTCLSRRTGPGITNGAVASGPTRQLPGYLVEVAATAITRTVAKQGDATCNHYNILLFPSSHYSLV